MARLRTDRALFVDIEETCWDGPPPEGFSPEIIEIGITEMDTHYLNPFRSESYLVRPSRGSVSAYCTALTGHTEDDLRANGRPITEVLRTLAKEFGPTRKVMMSWGDDWTPIQRACAAVGVDNPFPRALHQDIGKFFTLISGSAHGLGLGKAMEAAGLVFEGRRHRGKDDAFNTARLYAHHALSFRKANMELDDSPVNAPGAPKL